MTDRALPLDDVQPERIRYAVRQLRSRVPGLAKLPFGLVIATTPIVPWFPRSIGGRPPIANGALLLLAVLSLCLLAQLAIKRWYSRRFGTVLGTLGPPDARRASSGEMLFLVLLLGGVYLFETTHVGFVGEPALLCLAAVCASTWVFHQATDSHLGVLAALLVGGTVLIRTQPILSQNRGASVVALFALAVALHAIRDHLVIVRTLPAPPEEADENPVP